MLLRPMSAPTHIQKGLPPDATVTNVLSMCKHLILLLSPKSLNINFALS